MTACATQMALDAHQGELDRADAAFDAKERALVRKADRLMKAWGESTKLIDDAIGEHVGGVAWDELLEAMKAASEASTLKHPEERRLAAKVAGDKLVTAMTTMAWSAVGGDEL